MSYIITFYGPSISGNNPQQIPSGHPAVLNRFSPNLEFVSGSGYFLPVSQTYYTGEFSETFINENKAEFGIGDNQRYFTQDSYNSYLAANMPLYEEWKTGIANPSVKEKLMEDIKYKAQEKITTMLGYSPQDVAKWAARQINLTARFSELQDNLRLNGSWTPQEQYEYSALTGVWAKVKQIRNHSNYLEAVANSGIMPDINNGWPV